MGATGAAASSAAPQAILLPITYHAPQGGLGIEENVVTLCCGCHRAYDQGPHRAAIRRVIADYLQGFYPHWDESKLTYRK